MPKAGSTESKYMSIIQSISELTDDQTKMFMEMREDF